MTLRQFPGMIMADATLEKTINDAWEDRASVSLQTKGAVRDAVDTVLSDLDAGKVRIAERVAQGGFDAVLMDMVLPGIDGVEAIRRIRALRSDQRGIPIIGISGKDTDRVPARKAGADAFLLKPVSPRALATALLSVPRRSAAAATS